MKQTAMIAIFLLGIGVGPLAAQEKVVVGGSGALTLEIADLAKAYIAKNPSEAIQVLMEGMSNTGGMEGVKLGRLTIGLVSDEPKGADREKLVYMAVGRTPTGVAVNKSNSVGNLSEAQICDIFSGKIQSWKVVGGPDEKIMVLTRKKDDANTGTIRERMGCFKTIQITGDAIALVRGAEVLDALNYRPATIGIVNVNATLAERPNVKTLAIDGVAPSADSVHSGKYKFYDEKGVVTLGPPKGAAKRFLDFVASAEAQKFLTRRGMVGVK